jgi:hypothetical protein
VTGDEPDLARNTFSVDHKETLRDRCGNTHGTHEVARLPNEPALERSPGVYPLAHRVALAKVNKESVAP